MTTFTIPTESPADAVMAGYLGTDRVFYLPVDADGTGAAATPSRLVRDFYALGVCVNFDQLAVELYQEGYASVAEPHDECGPLGLVAKRSGKWYAFVGNSAYPHLQPLVARAFATRTAAVAALCWLDDEVVTPLECGIT